MTELKEGPHGEPSAYEKPDSLPRYIAEFMERNANEHANIRVELHKEVASLLLLLIALAIGIITYLVGGR